MESEDIKEKQNEKTTEIERNAVNENKSIENNLVEKSEGNPIASLLEAGVQIATKTKSPGMKRFIYKVREDGLYLLDVKTINLKIKVAAAMIARYNPKDIVVTASRIYAVVAAEKFSEIIGATFIKGRVTPGIFTNPNKKDYMEKKLIIISDSRNEKQAIKEASMENIPIIALCDTDNSTKFIDLIIPANNRGRKSLAYIYYLLAREVLLQRKEINNYDEFKHNISEFEAQMESKPTLQQA
ncbi:MAG: 30S ribosomal protein S2 [Candidatus Micrarchaeia archaeon]